MKNKAPRRKVPTSPCATPGCCGGLPRRDFLKLAGVGAALAMAPGLPVFAAGQEPPPLETLIPPDKNLPPDWVRSLFARGNRTVYRGKDLQWIGMPVGGICAGQIYLGGDGRLWHWDIFNQVTNTGAEHYAHPLVPRSPVDQGFSLHLKTAGKNQVRTLDQQGFSDVSFCGEYPIGYVDYRDDDCPVSVKLEAFSPFIPLNPEESHLPAVVMRFQLRNHGPTPVEGELAGWLENAVCLSSSEWIEGLHRNRIWRKSGMLFLECTAEPPPASPSAAERPPIVFADFEGDDYHGWTVEGEAFGKAPARGAPNSVQKLSGFLGAGLANSWTGSDEPVGRLISPAFTVERPYLSFLIGGGQHPDQTCLRLIVEGRPVRMQTGKNTDAMQWTNWNVREFLGRSAHLEIVDQHTGGWGHIDIDQIEFRDRPRVRPDSLQSQADYGALGLVLLETGNTDVATTVIPAGDRSQTLFSNLVFSPKANVTRPFGEKLCGALARKFALEPGQETSITFAVVWHFPNLRLGSLPGGRHYTTRFPSAYSVAEHLANQVNSLTHQTRLWHDTWYDSTLPYWFLDRTFANTSILATSTCHWFANGRFYGWEGVGCCEGTCTHVWHYAQAVARLFPQLERSAREMTDFDVAFNPATGAIGFRGETHKNTAADGQAGCVLRAYREHQMSADNAFLQRHWPRIKKALEFLIAQDGNADGLLEGKQHNTLDTDWYGPVAWLSGLYLAALRAGEEMAREMNDPGFADQTRAIFDSGQKKIVERLWNGEYFIHRPAPDHPEAMRSANGCEIDQVFGQHWAFQLGLGRVISETHVKQALQSLWRYNFATDVGPFRKVYPGGRWYAMPGEGGLVMCTWPKGDKKDAQGQAPDWAFGYFNECMTGFEYQAAGHLLWEGMTLEGLAITRTIHDRYHAARRNPWNEVECGDHYARAMASYGVYLAACGFEYHGPKGYLAFAPRLSPENFRAAFTTAEGWGTFSQRQEGPTLDAAVALKWGRLTLKTLALQLPIQFGPGLKLTVRLENAAIPASVDIQNGRALLTLEEPTGLVAGQTLEIKLSQR